MQTVYFRADGSNAMGVGHIYRCCALAQILAQDFKCVFLLSKHAEPEIISIISNHFSHYIHLQTPEEAVEVAHLLNFEDIVVLDGYHFNTAYQKIIKESGAKLVCIDDIAQYRFVADVVINHAGGIVPELYTLSPGTKLYLGPAYAIIRKPFVEAAEQKVEPISGRFLITMGGADPNNYTTTILNDLIRTTGTGRDIHVIAGAKFHFLNQLELIASKTTGIVIHSNITGEDMAGLMATTEYCIATPSTVAFEFFTCSKGIFVMQTIAGNQDRFADFLRRNDYAMDYSDFSKGQLKSLKPTEKISLVFDGKSHKRIIDIFKLLYIG